MENRCIQQGSSNKCVCNNCNKNMMQHGQYVPEIDFNKTNENMVLTKKDLKPVLDRLTSLEDKHFQTDYKRSIYDPPRYFKGEHEFTYPFRYRNRDNLWLHNEGGDFGGHSLYENPYVEPRNSDINNYAYGSKVPYYYRKFHSGPQI